MSLNNYKKLIFPTLIAVVCIALFFSNPSDSVAGVRDGLFLCGNTVIPSLFPFMILSDYLVRSGVSSGLGDKLSPATQKIFHLPGCSACVILMSLIGGFPVGAKMISQLYHSGELTEKQAQRMLWFCVNSGPAFIIGAVGATMLSSKKCGILLFLSQVVASLLIGFFSRFAAPKTVLSDSKIKSKINPSVLTESVACATDSMLNVCAWILLFSGFSRFLLKLTKISPLFNVLILLSEVTSGCSFAAVNLPVFFIAPVLCWSGFAVHLQLLPYIKSIGMPMKSFWLSRVLNCLVALLIAWILFRLFPCEVQVFASVSNITVKPYSVSVPAAVAMLVLGSFTIIDINLATDKKI